MQEQGENGAVIDVSGTPSAKNQEDCQDTTTNKASSPAMAIVSSVSRLMTRFMSAENASQQGSAA